MQKSRVLDIVQLIQQDPSFRAGVIIDSFVHLRRVHLEGRQDPRQPGRILLDAKNMICTVKKETPETNNLIGARI